MFIPLMQNPHNPKKKDSKFLFFVNEAREASVAHAIAIFA